MYVADRSRSHSASLRGGDLCVWIYIYLYIGAMLSLSGTAITVMNETKEARQTLRLPERRGVLLLLLIKVTLMLKVVAASVIKYKHIMFTLLSWLSCLEVDGMKVELQVTSAPDGCLTFLNITLRLWGNLGYFIQEVRTSAAGVWSKETWCF